jgi:hypothetical protein
MSRAFVNEDAGGEAPGNFSLPNPADPGFPIAAARALLRGADAGDTVSAEAATGYFWGDPTLEGEMTQLLAEARDAGDERTEQLAERFLNRIHRAP